MARIKSAYKNNSEPQFPAEKIAEEIPPSEKYDLDAEPATDAVVVHHESDKPPNDAIAEATDAATLRLQKQLDELKRSEELQRQHAQMTHTQPSREQLLHAWRQGGMIPADEEFLRANPALIDNPRLTALAANEAAQRHERGTDDHRRATKELFDHHLARLQARAQPAAEPPEFFRAPPPPEPRSAASIVSAPVSRGEVGGYREPSPSSVRLTPDELEIPRASGISPVEYARNKIRMQKEQRSGDRQR
jgi:hypothetical protein